MMIRTKKEIKKLKKDILFNGIREQNYSYNVFKNLKYNDILNAVTELEKNGIILANLEEWRQDDLILEEITKQNNYRFFKENLLPYLF